MKQEIIARGKVWGVRGGADRGLSKNSMHALFAVALSYRSLRCLNPVWGGGFGRFSSIILMQHFYRTLLLQFSRSAYEFAAMYPYILSRSFGHCDLGSLLLICRMRYPSCVDYPFYY